MSIELIPAIDLLDGRCVRLLHGDFDQCKVYDDDAAALAARYAAEGARWLHVVDLAASRDGAEADTRPLFDLLKAASQQVQTGGGVRGSRDVLKRLEHGARRVVVGSVCVNQPDRFAAWLQDFGADHLVAALDVRIDEDGTPWPRTFGWTRQGHSDLWQLLEFYNDRGLRHLLCTDIGRDGALSGPNVALYREIVRRFPRLELQASGGVASLDDLRELNGSGVSGVITGKALLEGRFGITAALEAVS
jgi:phosphoribosylformimino-5-aminoimidazole carboxamide ribotide isomerase